MTITSIHVDPRHLSCPVMTGGDRAYRQNKHGDVDATAIHPTITNYGSQKKSKSKSKLRRLPPKSIEIDRFLKSQNRPNTKGMSAVNVGTCVAALTV